MGAMEIDRCTRLERGEGQITAGSPMAISSGATRGRPQLACRRALEVRAVGPYARRGVA